MGDTIIVHDLNASQLVVGWVDVTSKHFVQSTGTSENDMRILHLNDPLSQPHEVCTNTNGSASYLDKEL